MSQAARIEAVAPRLREFVRQHRDGKFPEGDEALNAKMTKPIKDNDLSEVKVVSIDRTGCFSGNRWGAGLVAADVHYVLGEGFAKNGFNVQNWECMALTVPESVKKEWTDFNIKIVKQSNGLLPEIVDMYLATGRGSHGTGALRGAKFGCLASKRTKMLADDGGRIILGALLTKNRHSEFRLKKECLSQ